MHRDKKILVKDGLKYCKACDRSLDVSLFMKKKSKISNLYSTICAKCHNLSAFGINTLDYESLVESQNNKCAICNNNEKAVDKRKNIERSLAVDHCHETGKIRGLLCTNCNIGLGQFKDSLYLLDKAKKYLENSNK